MGRSARYAAIYGLGFLAGYIACWIILPLATPLTGARETAGGAMILMPAVLAGALAYCAPRHGVHWAVAVSLPMLLLWAPAIVANTGGNQWRLFPLMISLGLSTLVAFFVSSRKKLGEPHGFHPSHTSAFPGISAR